MRRASHSLQWLASALLLSGCVTARLSDVWKDPAQPAEPLTHLLVVSLSPSEFARRTWEDALVTGLRGHGVTATPSYDIWPDAPPDISTLSDEVQREAYDGVVLTHPAEVETTRTYVPGSTTLVPAKTYDPWKRHYVTYYTKVRQPGHVDVSTSLRLDTDVWMPADQFRMIWTGTTQAMNPTSTDATNKAIIGAILPRLAKQGVIPPAQKR